MFFSIEVRKTSVLVAERTVGGDSFLRNVHFRTVSVARRRFLESPDGHDRLARVLRHSLNGRPFILR
jgi:hypothetical protein